MRKTPICECRLHLFNDGKHGTIEDTGNDAEENAQICIF